MSHHRFKRLAGAVRHALEQASDRRAAQQAESRYQGLYDSVPVGLYRTTIDGSIIDVNSAMVQLLNYPNREALLRANAAAMYVNALDRERGVAMLRRDGLLQDFEVQLRRFDGSSIWVLDNVRSVRAPDGHVNSSWEAFRISPIGRRPMRSWKRASSR